MRVRMLRTVGPDMYGEGDHAHAGNVYDAGMNQHGAVWVKLHDGSELGVKPDEYEVAFADPPELARLPEVVRLRWALRHATAVIDVLVRGDDVISPEIAEEALAQCRTALAPEPK